MFENVAKCKEKWIKSIDLLKKSFGFINICLNNNTNRAVDPQSCSAVTLHFDYLNVLDYWKCISHIQFAIGSLTDHVT